MKSKKLLTAAAIILLQCLFTATLFAQNPPPKQWDKRFGGIDAEYFTSLQQTTDGGYILGGASFSGFGGDKTEASRGLDDYWVVKMDVNGIKQWDKRFGGTNIDYLQSLQQTADGGYILGGSSNSGIGGDKTEDSRGLNDYWVVKIDANGIKQWDKRFGGTSSDYLGSLQQTSDGGYILGGSSASEIGGDKTEDSRGLNDYWVVKIDANGIKQWDKRFGGTSSDYLGPLQQTTDGGYILGGWGYSGIGGDKTEASRGVEDYWIVKIAADGIKQWDKTFGGASSDYLESLQQTSDGGYILGGYSNSGIGGDKSEASRGGTDYWVIKLGENSIKQWDKRFGGASEDELYSFQQTSDGWYILGGASSSGIGGDKTEAGRGDRDCWIVKIDANGIKQWDKRFGGTSGDLLTSLQQTRDGGYILGGHSSSDIGGDKTEASRGFSDYWVVKIGCPPAADIIAAGKRDICLTGSVVLKVNSTDTLSYKWYKNNVIIAGAKGRDYTATSIGKYKVVVSAGPGCKNSSNILKVTNSCGLIAETGKTGLAVTSQPISVYPNPTKGVVTLAYSSSKAAAVQLTVFDITGKPVFTKTANAAQGKNVFTLNLSHLAAGIYNLQVNNAGVQQQVRVVIER